MIEQAVVVTGSQAHVRVHLRRLPAAAIVVPG
jgi:hypothetical protein